MGALPRYLDAEKATWEEARDYLAHCPAAILPLGATEQHGPHLPQGTDTIIAREVCRRVAERTCGYLLPPIPITYSWVWKPFPGSPWLRMETFMAVVKDIARSLEWNGVRALLLISGHGANQSPMKYAVRDLIDSGSKLAVLHGVPFGLDDVLAELDTKTWRGAYEIHAEEYETSLMLALAPELVDMSKARADYPDAPPDFGKSGLAMGDVAGNGVFGDPTTATREKGERWLDWVVERTASLWRDFLERNEIDVPEPPAS